MTASLPSPQEPASDAPESLDERAGGPRPVPARGGRPAKAPAKKSATTPAKKKRPRPAESRPAREPVAFADPGPPPPLPRDLDDGLDIPPMPPLPPIPLTVRLDPPAPPSIDPVEAEAEVPADVEIEEPAEPEPPAEPVAAEPVPQEPAEVVDDPFAEPLELADTDGATSVADEPTEDPAPADDAVLDAVEDFDLPRLDEGDAVLSLRGVTKAFGDTRAVDSVDLTVPAGTFYGIVGPNGAGKTTTLSMVAGLLRPDRGTIHVAGVDAAAKPLAAKRLIGVLPDRLRTFDRLTGRQLLHYYGVLRGLPAAVVERRTEDLARAFDLTDALGRVVSDYSLGMAKKVMLAGAMIHSPRLLVLDEPFEAVDPVSSAVILDILSAYVAHGGTVILSSHGMDLVERVCSRVAVIVAGQVLAEGTVAEVRGELTLEQRFVELAGGLSDVEGLEWLHTFSD